MRRSNRDLNSDNVSVGHFSKVLRYHYATAPESHRGELNSHLFLRRETICPLNYGDEALSAGLEPTLGL